MADLDTPITGAQVARAIWDIDTRVLRTLMPAVADPIDADDTRAQFSLWATSQSTVTFASFAEAWNAFITPPGAARPAVYLPGSPCQRCRGRRFNVNDLGRSGYAHCPVCRGTGRKPPRALPALLARQTFTATTTDLATDTTPMTGTAS